MLSRDQHLEYCRKCVNRQMDSQQGLICKLTGRTADFDPTCPNFKVDESVKEEPKKDADVPVVVKSEDIPAELREAMRTQQDIVYAAIGGLAAAILGGIIWGAVTYLTNYQIGYMAIGVGLLVGFAVRYFGAGIDVQFGIIGAAFAIFGCLLGNLFSQIAFLAEAESMTYFQVIPYLNLSTIQLIYLESFSPMDLLFYGIAGYEGYRFAFRPVTEDLIRQSAGGTVPPMAYSKLRIPLVAVLFAIVSVSVFLIYSGNSSIHTAKYESGNKHYEGLVENGLEQGPWTFWYESGKVQQKGYFKDGKLDSTWEYFYEEGALYRTGRFVASQQDGPWIEYDPYGKIISESSYSLGRLHGPFTNYYQDGTVNQRSFFKLDRPDSSIESFSESGSPLSKGFFKNGEPAKVWFYWFDNGKPSMEVEYMENGYTRIRNAWEENGKQQVKDGNGTFTSYDENGNRLWVGQVANAERVGVWTKYYPQPGKVQEEGEYHAGVYHVINYWSLEGALQVTKGEGVYSEAGPDGSSASGRVAKGLKEGQWVDTSTTGDTLQVANFVSGKLDGKRVAYNEEGAIVTEGIMRKGKHDGEWKWYHANGQLQTSATFQMGVKQGEQVFYEDDGAISRTEVYRDGKLIEVRLP